MPRRPESSAKAERDQLRDRMRALGCSIPQSALEMGRRFNLRPRVAWRQALGWPQWKVAQRFNTLYPEHRLSDHRVSEHETWPHGGAPFSLRYLVRLAATYGHGCTPDQLVDADDLEHLTQEDRRLLTSPPNEHAPTPTIPEISRSVTRVTHSHDSDRVFDYRGGRRVVRCDAWGVPIREEVVVAAEESAQFHRWSATTNVDDGVLEQMAADVAELAWRELTDPPATLFTRLLGTRDDVFALIAGRQQPRHTAGLYKIAGQLSGLLAVATFDLGHPHAAATHARTALHCADMAGYTPLRTFIRRVQSNMAYWDGRYDEAAVLIESALPNATSGTALLGLASQQARIHAARHLPGEVSRVLALATTAPTERTPAEPGIIGFDTWSAAYYASEAHCALGGAEDLDAAVDWAHHALDELTAEPQPKTSYLATARFVLANAHLARGELEAVGEHLAPVLHSTHAEYHTATLIGRARSLNTLLAQRTDLASPTLTALRDGLAEFYTHPAPTPPGLEPDTTT